jgi:hypothetical protein
MTTRDGLPPAYRGLRRNLLNRGRDCTMGRARLTPDKGDMPMKMLKNIDVLFVAGFGPIVRDPAASRKFYSEALGLSLSPALASINGPAIFPCRKVGSSLT